MANQNCLKNIAFVANQGQKNCIISYRIQLQRHPPLESILGLDFNEHGKTLYYSIFCPFCYTVGVSHFLFMEGFPYRGKMDIIYTKLWDFERVSQYDLYRIIVFITHLYSGNSIIYASVA